MPETSVMRIAVEKRFVTDDGWDKTKEKPVRAARLGLKSDREKKMPRKSMTHGTLPRNISNPWCCLAFSELTKQCVHFNQPKRN